MNKSRCADITNMVKGEATKYNRLSRMCLVYTQIIEPNENGLERIRLAKELVEQQIEERTKGLGEVIKFLDFTAECIKTDMEAKENE